LKLLKGKGENTKDEFSFKDMHSRETRHNLQDKQVQCLV